MQTNIASSPIGRKPSWSCPGILDVAVGLVFLYLLLSLICSAINELIEANAADAGQGPGKGLTGASTRPVGTGLVKQLYEHPLVFGPYANPGLFMQLWCGRKTLVYSSPILCPGPDGYRLPGSRIATLRCSLAQLSCQASFNSTLPASLPSLRDAIAKLPPDHPLFNKNVADKRPIVTDRCGRQRINKARDNIESWFNNANDRYLVAGTSGGPSGLSWPWGLRWQFSCYADTITIARSLSMDMAIRGSLADPPLNILIRPAAPTCRRQNIN